MAAMLDYRSDTISITTFINPHLFWFKYDTSFMQPEYVKLNSKIQEYIISLTQQGRYANGYTPKVGEIVIVNQLPWDKWIRAKVKKIDQNGTKYHLWSIDNG